MDLEQTMLQAEINYLNYRINKYTSLIEIEAFTGESKRLLEEYVNKMLDRKLQNQKILEAIK